MDQKKADNLRNLFRHAGYNRTNEERWKIFDSMNIAVEGCSIFECGAGIGDHTKWLLRKNPKYIYVNEGRQDNIGVLVQELSECLNTVVMPGNLEDCLHTTSFDFNVDLIYAMGIFYHLANPENVTEELAKKGQVLVMDYLTGPDVFVDEAKDDPSQSMEGRGNRLSEFGAVKLLRNYWKFVYKPKAESAWLEQNGRRILVASHTDLNNDALKAA